MQELIDNVVQWARDRNLIDGSTPAKQLEKTAAEFTELCIAVGRDEMLAELGLSMDPASPVLEKSTVDVADGIGDVLVTLIIVSEQLGLDIQDCLSAAYNEIKDRKGKLVNGKFEKENN